MLAGIAVTAAEPSGLWGAFKEAFASSSALAVAKSSAGSNKLIKAVVADFETKDGPSCKKHCANVNTHRYLRRPGAISLQFHAGRSAGPNQQRRDVDPPPAVTESSLGYWCSWGIPELR